jgi:hypothetical protein
MWLDMKCGGVQCHNFLFHMQNTMIYNKHNFLKIHSTFHNHKEIAKVIKLKSLHFSFKMVATIFMMFIFTCKTSWFGLKIINFPKIHTFYNHKKLAKVIGFEIWCAPSSQYSTSHFQKFNNHLNDNVPSFMMNKNCWQQIYCCNHKEVAKVNES